MLYNILLNIVNDYCNILWTCTSYYMKTVTPHLYTLDLSLEANFEQFYTGLFDEFYKFTLIKCSDPEIALDICQTCFTKLWQEIRHGKQVKNPRAFFYKLLRNAIIDYYRKKKTVSLDVLQESGFDPGTDGRPNTPNDIDQILERLNTIPEKYRDIVIMKFVMDLSITEICDRTGLSENVVSVHIYRGRTFAREILGDIYAEYQL